MKHPKSTPHAPADPNRIAVLSALRQGNSGPECDVIVAHVNDGSVRLLDTQAFSGVSAFDDAHTWIQQHLASRTILMLAGCDVICRTVTMPTASADQLEMALRLQIENLLLGGAARWRTDATLLPTTDPDRDRIALLVEWPLSTPGPDVPPSFTESLEVRYAPPIAALVALVTNSIANGERESLAMYLEKSTGAISIAYWDGMHSAFRTMREDGSDEATWNESILRCTIETLLLADVPQPSIDAAMAALTTTLANHSDGLIAPLSTGAASFGRVTEGFPADDEWWYRCGILLGTAIACTGPLARIASLKSRPVVAEQRLLHRVMSAARNPQVATRLAIATLLIAAIVPPAFSGLRLLALEWILPDAAAYERALTRADQQSAMYREYERYAWPMGKLLGDLSSTTPEGIELESIALNQGSSLDLHGNAKPQGNNSAAEAILLMERQLRESRVFDRIEKNWDPPNQNGIISFDMKATIANPSLVPNFPEAQDFSRRTLRDRRYGVVGATDAAPTRTSGESSAVIAQGDDEKAAAPVALEGSPDAPPSTSTKTAAEDGGTNIAASTQDDARTGKRRGTGAATAAPGATRRGQGAGESNAPVIPDPLSDEQIQAMTQTEAREALGKVSTARGISGIDEASEARLKAEFYKLLEQARKQ
ncbi:MAG: hypothetical protein EXS15_03400 [Phycisphaerales bacterium]|nr:hypothetical protein [Phycisphaerales bacterium]